ncbi:MAG: DUF790 family protein [Magnetococcales bacterium]|nr:DUF790 family protein [Magnetococcales bacterium]
MLTRDLLRFDRRNQSITPRFLDPKDRHWQEVAETLALVYESGCGYSREELTELTLPIQNTTRSPLVAKGLNKLLLDRCTFEETDAELEQWRMQVFSEAARILRAPSQEEQTTVSGSNNLEVYRQRVGDLLSMPADLLATRLYRDLPARQSLLAFKPLAPEALLHRYNMAQAQGLLWWSQALSIDTDESDVGVLRPFFRYLKFFRLLARITRSPAGGFHIQLDGPLSLFENSRKYGILLANFFPAVCSLSHWQVQADIDVPLQAAPGQVANRRPQHGPARLKLDDSMGLRSHFTQTHGYWPEEFEQFSLSFSQSVPTWTIQENPELLELGKQEWFVPDFSFRHESGLLVHLELFHRWHAGQLQRRLRGLAEQRSTGPLLAVGVDRFLTRQAESQALLEGSAWYQQHGFAFNVFPPVKRVLACLDTFRNAAVG